MTRKHEWIPTSSDFTEWECKHCGHQVDSIGPPCKNLKVVYKAPDTGEELEMTCEAIEEGVVNCAVVHDI